MLIYCSSGKHHVKACTHHTVIYRNYFVKLFWRKGPTSKSVMELNETNDRTLDDFEKYNNYCGGHYVYISF